MQMIGTLLVGMMLLLCPFGGRVDMPEWQEKVEEYLEARFAGTGEKAQEYMELLLDGEYECVVEHMSDEAGDVTADMLRYLIGMNVTGEVESVELVQFTHTGKYDVFSYEVTQGGRQYLYWLMLNSEREIAGLKMRRVEASMPTAVPAEREMDWQAVAQEQLELWLAGEYDLLIEQADENVIPGVTAEALSWMTDTYGGKAQEYALYDEAEVEGYHRVQYYVKHSNGESIYSISLNGNGKIAGFGIQKAADVEAEKAGQ